MPRRAAFVALAALVGLACDRFAPRKASSDDEPKPAVVPVGTVPPVLPIESPIDDAAVATQPPAEATPLERAREHEARGQLWMARLLLESRALGDAGTPAEAELLGRVCQRQGDAACVDAAKKKLGPSRKRH